MGRTEAKNVLSGLEGDLRSEQGLGSPPVRPETEQQQQQQQEQPQVKNLVFLPNLCFGRVREHRANPRRDVGETRICHLGEEEGVLGALVGAGSVGAMGDQRHTRA